MAMQSEPPSEDDNLADDYEKPLPGETRHEYEERRMAETFPNENLHKDVGFDTVRDFSNAHRKELDQINKDADKYFGERQYPNLVVPPVGKLTPPDVSPPASGQNKHSMLKKPGLAHSV
jgi:hypothetical protein